MVLHRDLLFKKKPSMYNHKSEGTPKQPFCIYTMLQITTEGPWNAMLFEKKGWNALKKITLFQLQGLKCKMLVHVQQKNSVNIDRTEIILFLGNTTI